MLVPAVVMTLTLIQSFQPPVTQSSQAPSTKVTQVRGNQDKSILFQKKVPPQKKNSAVETKQTKKRPLGNSGFNSQMIQEIQDLRSELGGNPLGLSDKEAREVFAKELQKLSQQDKKPGTQNSLAPSSPYAKANSSSKVDWTDTRSSIPNRLTKTRSRKWVQARRQIARQLDQLASDLEDLEEYQQADKLRQQAAEIRKKCREVKIIEAGEKLPKPLSSPTLGNTSVFG